MSGPAGRRGNGLTPVRLGTATDLAKKLQLKEGQRLAVLDRPAGVDLGVDEDPDGGAVLGFARMRADLPRMAPVLEAARQDRLAWIAYPKTGALGRT